MATRREELEQALRVSWTAATLAVYGDHLLQHGDPRGELISLDLTPRPGDDAWRARRREVLVAWLGEELASRYGRFIQHGFLHVVRSGTLPGYTIEPPLSAVIRELWIWCSTAASLAKQLEGFVLHPHPWLTRLVIEYEGAHPVAAAPLIGATPHLEELYTLGDRAFATFHHPTLQRLYVTPTFGGRDVAAPETNATVIPVDDLGGVDRYRPIADERLYTILGTIDAVPDANVLYTHHALAEPRDSVAGLIVRLSAARVVDADGPIVRLSALGRRVFGWLGSSQRPTPRAIQWVAADIRVRIAYPDRIDSEYLGSVRQLQELLVDAVAGMPFDDAERGALVRFLGFLTTATATRQSRGLYGDKALAPALDVGLQLHDLGDRGLMMFDAVGAYEDWRRVRLLQRFLEWCDEERSAAEFVFGYDGAAPVPQR